jgi:hypothetical protein
MWIKIKTQGIESTLALNEYFDVKPVEYVIDNGAATLVYLTEDLDISSFSTFFIEKYRILNHYAVSQPQYTTDTNCGRKAISRRVATEHMNNCTDCIEDRLNSYSKEEPIEGCGTIGGDPEDAR